MTSPLCAVVDAVQRVGMLRPERRLFPLERAQVQRPSLLDEGDRVGDEHRRDENRYVILTGGKGYNTFRNERRVIDIKL